MNAGAALSLAAQNYSDYTKDPRPDVPEGTWTVGGIEGEVFQGSATGSELKNRMSRLHGSVLNDLTLPA